MILLAMLLCLKTFLILKMFEVGIWSEKLLIKRDFFLGLKNRDIRKLNLRLILNSEERRNTLHWFRKYYIDFLTFQMTFSNHLKNIINQVRQNPWFPDSENNFVLLPWTHSFPYVQINKWKMFINWINGGLVGGRTYQDGHSVLVSDILDIPILNNLIADFSTDPRCPRFEDKN